MEINICHGLTLSSVIYNSSTPATSTHFQLKRVGESKSGAVVTKSCTVVPITPSSDFKRYEYDTETQTSYNRNGLINKGVDYFLSYTPQVDKPYILSFYPIQWEDIKYIACHEEINRITSVELNISCPNINAINSGSLKKIVRKAALLPIPVGIKVAPSRGLTDVHLMVNLLRENSHIKYIVCGNTLTDQTSPKGFIGAMGGKKIKQLTMWNVKHYCRLLDIPVIACGGVSCGRDVIDYLHAGATAVQIGTCFYQEGEICFSRILSEMEECTTTSKL